MLLFYASSFLVWKIFCNTINVIFEYAVVETAAELINSFKYAARLFTLQCIFVRHSQTLTLLHMYTMHSRADLQLDLRLLKLQKTSIYNNIFYFRIYTWKMVFLFICLLFVMIEYVLKKKKLKLFNEYKFVEIWRAIVYKKIDWKKKFRL